MTEAAAAATTAPAQPEAQPAAEEAPKLEATTEEPEEKKLNGLQRYAQDAARRKAAKLAAAGKPITRAEPAAAATPERGPDGKFMPSAGKTDEEEPASAAEPNAAVEAAQEKLEDAGVKVPEQKPQETDRQYELRLSQLLREKKSLQAELLEMKSRHEPTAKELDRFKGLMERVRGGEIDEEALEALTGRTFEQLVRDIARGAEEGGAKFKPKAKLPPELASLRSEMEAELAEIRAFKEERKREAEEARAAAEKAEQEKTRKEVWSRETQVVAKHLEDNADKYPRVSSLAGGPERLLQRWYDKWAEAKWSPDAQPDLDEVAAEMESGLSGELGAIFGSERALRVALADPKTRDLVVKLLGTQNATSESAPTRKPGQPAKAQSEGPATLSNKVSQEVPAPAEKKELSEEEERAAYHARMRAANKAREEAMKARFNRG